jgi:hypothetical protein
MIRILGRRSKLCDGFTRREMLRAGSLAGLGLGYPSPVVSGMPSGGAEPAAGSARSIILINLIGGPSHIDMFDMKPQAPVEIRGEFQPIDSSVPGLQVCEHLPLTAQTMHHSTLIRTHSHLYNTHSPYNMLTGYSGPVIVDNVAKPTDQPSIGSVMQYAGLRSQGVPSYVWMPSHPGHSQGKYRAGPYGGFLGRQFDPVFTAYTPRFEDDAARRTGRVNPPTPYGDAKLPLLDEMPPIELDRLNRRRSLVQQFDDQTSLFAQDRAAANLSENRRQAFELLSTNRTRDAFDLSLENTDSRERYGCDLFGSSMLTARRLVEAGVRFVGVTTESQLDGNVGAGQWDTHSNNFNLLRNFNLPNLDRNYSALIEDLHDRGLLESTLVVLMGEMGRTPKVNKNSGGRDHWTQCGFILLTGGGVKRGFTYGKSDRQGAWPADHPVSSADYVATVYQLLGLDPHMLIRDDVGTQVPIALHGHAIHDVIA